MSCSITVLPVGNADSMVIQANDSIVIVDLGNLRILEEWLERHDTHKIARIYITHAHSDHFPSLIKLSDFLAAWFEHGVVDKIHLPDKVIRIAKQRVLSDRHNPKFQRLELALNRIHDWDANSTLKITPVVRDGEEFLDGALKISALHPSHVYLEEFLARDTIRLNEMSLVLRVQYGDFSGLLLADVEGHGLQSLLNFLQINSAHNDFTANFVKIPHHGAWPANGDDLVSLLRLLDPELAVLSVGSKNQHNHVKPELFDALLNLKNDDSCRFGNFMCTEATRTCVHSSSQIATMGKKGLPAQKLCAGEITITAEQSGQWSVSTETDHSSIIDSLAYAACNAISE